MRGLLLCVVLGLLARDAMAQPADCAAHAATGPSQHLSIGLTRHPGVPSGVTGKASIEVPMAAPQTECGGPSAPSDVLGGPPGDLLRGAAPPTQAGR
jgi:hypothetical protein